MISNLPNNAVPWGRAVVQRLDKLRDRIAALSSGAVADHLGAGASLKALGETVTRREAIGTWRHTEWYELSNVVAPGAWLSDARMPKIELELPTERVRVQVSASAAARPGRISVSVVDLDAGETAQTVVPRDAAIAKQAAPWIYGAGAAAYVSGVYTLEFSYEIGRRVLITPEFYAETTLFGQPLPSGIPNFRTRTMSISVEAIS